METQQWKVKFSFKNATIIVCLLNIVTALFLIQGFLSPPSSTRRLSSDPHFRSLAVEKHLKESEELRRVMQPLQLIRRVREIQQKAYNSEPETVQQKDTSRQTAAFDLSKRLNGFRSTSDSANQRALEEWRKRKMERARQRELGRNGTLSS